MDLGSLSRMVPPPPPEPPSLSRFGLLLAAGMFSMAMLIAFLDPVVALWHPLILLYPVAALGLLVTFLHFIRAKRRYYDSYWTEERRAHHYLNVRAGLAHPAPEPLPAPPWRRRPW